MSLRNEKASIVGTQKCIDDLDSAIDGLQQQVDPLAKIITKAGVPGSGELVAKGSLCIDLTNANLYINAGDAVTPAWKLVTRAA